MEETGIEEPRSVPPAPDDTDRARVVEALGPTPVEIDDLIRYTGLAAPQIHMVLVELDLAGQLCRHGGNLVSLATAE